MRVETWTMNPHQSEGEIRVEFEDAVKLLRIAGQIEAREIAADIYRMGYDAGYHARADQEDRD